MFLATNCSHKGVEIAIKILLEQAIHQLLGKFSSSKSIEILAVGAVASKKTAMIKTAGFSILIVDFARQAAKISEKKCLNYLRRA